MYAVPVLFTQSAFETPYCGLKNGGISPIAPSVSSSASSDVSFGCLDRRDSTSSNVSTAASSTASVKESPSPKHRKSLSNGSISRRLLQKRKTHQPQRQSVSLPTSSPVITLPPIAPAPVASPPSPPTTEVKGSDLVVKCRNQTYNCDRAIMCYHSRWFARVCAIVMSPKSSKGAIDLSADDPCAVAAMMQYCYQLDYDHLASSDDEIPEVATLRSHVNVYMLAERYGVAGLRALAMQKFKDLAAMVLDEDGHEDQLQSAIRAIFAPDRIANGDELRHMMVKLCADHVQAFIHDTGKKMSLVYESMEEFPEFRVELFEEMGSRWRC